MDYHSKLATILLTLSPLVLLPSAWGTAWVFLWFAGANAWWLALWKLERVK